MTRKSIFRLILSLKMYADGLSWIGWYLIPRRRKPKPKAVFLSSRMLLDAAMERYMDMAVFLKLVNRTYDRCFGVRP